MSEDAYFAGIIDGEGCISFYRNTSGGRASGRTRVLGVTVGMTCRPVLEALHRRFGGSINKRKKIHPHRKQQYAWHVCANNAEACLEAVLPWLIEKREQAEVGLQARSWQKQHTVRGKGHGSSNLEAYYQKADEFDARLKSLKSKEFL